jgi:hypothetical protein
MLAIQYRSFIAKRSAIVIANDSEAIQEEGKTKRKLFLYLLLAIQYRSFIAKRSAIVIANDSEAIQEEGKTKRNLSCICYWIAAALTCFTFDFKASYLTINKGLSLKDSPKSDLQIRLPSCYSSLFVHTPSS